MQCRQPCVGREAIAEFIGTYILVFFGVGSVHAAVLTGAQAGLWQVAAVWGVAISLAIYATGAISGAHINPAMTVAFTAFRGFPLRKVPAYLLAQLTGAIAGAATLYGLFHNLIARFERANHIVRGSPGSELSAMVFGEYFPNPALFGPVHEAVHVDPERFIPRAAHEQAVIGRGLDGLPHAAERRQRPFVGALRVAPRLVA